MSDSRKTEENNFIFQTILDTFGDEGEKCTVKTYWSENREYWIDIVTSPDSPFKQVSSYATIALSDFSIGQEAGEKHLGVELVGACDQKFDVLPEIIATCAGNIIQNHESCFPGAIFTDVVGIYLPESVMKHILFVPPFGWEPGFETLEFETKTVAWLFAMPISDAEYQYSRGASPEALISLLKDKRVDIYNLNRASAL